jgi:hypothetical protein
MIIEIVSQCEKILTVLDQDYKLNDDEWFFFIKKTITLSANFDGFKHVKINAIKHFDLNFSNLSRSAKNILK